MRDFAVGAQMGLCSVMKPWRLLGRKTGKKINNYLSDRAAVSGEVFQEI